MRLAQRRWLRKLGWQLRLELQESLESPCCLSLLERLESLARQELQA